MFALFTRRQPDFFGHGSNTISTDFFVFVLLQIDVLTSVGFNFGVTAAGSFFGTASTDIAASRHNLVEG
jgi:hypothetical protein